MSCFHIEVRAVLPQGGADIRIRIARLHAILTLKMRASHLPGDDWFAGITLGSSSSVAGPVRFDWGTP